jgi:Mg2+ and Co2+ transporter CorA
MEYQVSPMTGLISIIESQRSLQETKVMKALTLLGMNLIPFAFTSGIFGMSGKYAAGETYFWVYFAVALPIVLLVFIMAYTVDKVSSWRRASR